MKHSLAKALLVGAVAWQCGAASAATIRVEKDGTGDFTIIQDAVDAAEPGDTILVGPGRYAARSQFSLPGWTESTHVGIETNDLTIRGVDRDAVIIGPATSQIDGLGPKGFVTQVGIQKLTVENLTVENVRDGFYVVGEVGITNVRVRGTVLGVISFAAGGLTIRSAWMSDNDTGVMAFAPTSSVLVEGCRFDSGAIGVSLQAAGLANVSLSRFSGLTVGVQYDNTSGAVSGCSFEASANLGLTALGSSTAVDVIDNAFSGGQGAIHSRSGAFIVGSGNSILGTTYASILVSTGGNVVLSDNDIVPASGHGGKLNIQFDPVTLDIRRNYWGVESSSEVEALIWDANDDPTLGAVFEFEPFEVRSVSVTSSSVGELKARFGGNN